MWSARFFVLCFLALTLSVTQSHVIQKRGLISKLFGGDPNSNRNVDKNMSPAERSKFKELIKNPIVITMITAAAGLLIQKALTSKDRGDMCNNKFVQMARMAGNFHPHLQQAVNLLGCNGANRDRDSTPVANPSDDAESNSDANDNIPEKKSRIQQLLGMVTGGPSDFIKGLFGSKKTEDSFKAGDTLPSSSYQLDDDDANVIKNFNKKIQS